MLPWRMPLRWDAPVITPDCFNEGQGPAQKKSGASPTAAEGVWRIGILLPPGFKHQHVRLLCNLLPPAGFQLSLLPAIL
jgi:hypothetical protein